MNILISAANIQKITYKNNKFCKKIVKATIKRISASTETCDADMSFMAVETFGVARLADKRHIECVAVVQNIAHNLLAGNIFYLSDAEIVF